MLGIYEVSIKKMSNETDIRKDEIEKGLKVFESLSKVKYIGNYVVLVNYMKHQNFNTNMKKSAIDIYNSLPEILKNNTVVVSKANPLEGFETLLKYYGMVSKDEVEEETELELEFKEETKGEKESKSETSPKKEYGKPEINEIIEYLKEKLGGLTLDKTVKVNRQFANHLINKIKKDYPDKHTVQSIKVVIDQGLKDKFHGPKMTNFQYIYNNLNTIINSLKNGKATGQITADDMSAYLKRKRAGQQETD
jgi:hypothetical protein